MKTYMLVLLNRLDSAEDWLSQVRETTMMHGIEKVYLARVTPPFSSRVQDRVAPALLDMMAQMSDAAASKYLSKIADDLRKEGIETEPIRAGMPAKEIHKFIENNDIVLIVTTDGRSGLCRWASGGLTERHVQFLCEHIFGPMQPTRQDRSHWATTRRQKQRARKAEHSEEYKK